VLAGMWRVNFFRQASVSFLSSTEGILFLLHDA
jgi:hypothetical protein